MMLEQAISEIKSADIVQRLAVIEELVLSLKQELAAKSDNVQTLNATVTREEFYNEGLASIAHYKETGLHTSLDEMIAWSDQLVTDINAAKPTCHK